MQQKFYAYFLFCKKNVGMMYVCYRKHGGKIMKIDVETLINSLNNLKLSEDISWREVERQSGVYNVS